MRSWTEIGKAPPRAPHAALQRFARLYGVDESGSADDLRARLKVRFLSVTPWTFHWFVATVHCILPGSFVGVCPSRGHVSLRLGIGWRAWWPPSRAWFERRLREALEGARPAGITYDLTIGWRP